MYSYYFFFLDTFIDLTLNYLPIFFNLLLLLFLNQIILISLLSSIADTLTTYDY